MRSAKSVGLLAALLLIAASATSLVAWGEITLHNNGDGGESQWWYREQHPEVCSDLGDYCEEADHWGVELATYFEEDWAYVGLDCASRFTLADIADGTGPSFEYVMVGTPGSNSGPKMAFLLEDGGNYYLAISEAAPATGDLDPHDCDTFDAGAADWWWGTVDMDDETADVSSFANDAASPGTFAQLQASSYAGYNVVAALVLMGEVGSSIGCEDIANLLPIEAGQAVVDDVYLSWTEGGVAGGLYRLEPAWLEVVGFDDWTQEPLPTDEPEREWAKWCLCDHCLDIDDQNLWNLIRESDLDGTDAPSAAMNFPSDEYALYFGNIDHDANTANYDRGEASVGVVCSPWNELNPGDRYVSITFEYLREVESYMGPYDWTYVQIMFDDWTDLAWDPFAATADYPDGDGDENPGDVMDCDGVNWKTVWYKDSSDPNEQGWQEAVITHYLDADEDPYVDDEQRIIIPPHATRMRIRFGFNSQDGASNDYFGWLIDNIVKTHTPEKSGCTICIDFLPQAVIGEKYDVPLCPQIQGGATTGPREWELTSVTKDGERTSLPRRLAFDPIGRLYGTPDPDTAGTYMLTFELTCFEGRPQTVTLALNIRPASGPGAHNEIGRSQDFDDCPGGPCCANGDGLMNSGEYTVEGQPIPTAPIDSTNLWHQTGHVKYGLDGAAAECEYGHVAYFGQDDDGTPTDEYDPNFANGRTKGCMYTPLYQVPAEFDGLPLVLGFKSWRNVEYFPGGEYDKTWVDMKLEGGPWQTIWSRSSKDLSEAEWTWQEADTGSLRTPILLKGGVKIQLRFCFDSVDSSANGKPGEAYGWMVDEITLYAGGAGLTISSCPDSEASVEEFYNEELRASGGSVALSPIWEITNGDLPLGLGLVVDPADRRIANIQGTPRIAGTYTFTIRVRSADWSEVTTRECTIEVGRQTVLLFEDFEEDPAWAQGGLWHFTTDGGVTSVDDLGAGNHAAYYGQNDATPTPDYNTQARTTGTLSLVTPIVALAGVDAFTVEFDSWREVEDFGKGGYDKTFVQVKLGDGDWKTVWMRDSSDECSEEWLPEVLDTGAVLTEGAATLQIRFVFDSVDRWFNDNVGWLIDNLKIKSASAADANPLSLTALRETQSAGRDTPAEFQVMNIPNPITDVHTTVFTVRSTDVAAMRIVIFDLAGNKVYEEEVPGNELVWHTDNNYGEYLANGIYLYRAYILVNGVWVETTAQKLVILR